MYACSKLQKVCLLSEFKEVVCLISLHQNRREEGIIQLCIEKKRQKICSIWIQEMTAPKDKICNKNKNSDFRYSKKRFKESALPAEGRFTYAQNIIP